MAPGSETQGVDGGGTARCVIIIVNYRTAALVEDCLASLDGEMRSGPGIRVIVVENASGDDSGPRLRAAIAAGPWTDRVRLIGLDRNGGFAAGNNAGLREVLREPSPPKYLFLLNPDTVARPGSVRELLAFMDGHPAAGIVGCRLEDPDGTLQPAAFRFPTVLSEVEGSMNVGVVTKLLRSRRVSVEPVSEPSRVDWVSGAAMMIRRSVFEKIGLMDEGFFLYFEELDFCRRAAAAGFEVWHLPASRIVHLVSRSTGISDRSVRRPGYWFESRHRYWLKNHAKATAMAADAARILGTAICRVQLMLRGKPNWMPRHYLRDLAASSVFARGFKV